MIAAIFNSVWTPLAISFDYAIHISNDSSTLLAQLSAAADVVFFLDILIHFLASYTDIASGSEITEPAAIAKHYLKGAFLFDFISTVPLKWLAAGLYGAGEMNVALRDLSDMTKLLKAFRIQKIQTKIKDSNISSQDKALAIVCYYVLLIVIYTHVTACLLWWFLKTDRIWVPPVEYGALSPRVYFAEMVSLLPAEEADGQRFELFAF